MSLGMEDLTSKLDTRQGNKTDKSFIEDREDLKSTNKNKQVDEQSSKSYCKSLNIDRSTLDVTRDSHFH